VKSVGKVMVRGRCLSPRSLPPRLKSEGVPCGQPTSVQEEDNVASETTLYLETRVVRRSRRAVRARADFALSRAHHHVPLPSMIRGVKAGAGRHSLASLPIRPDVSYAVNAVLAKCCRCQVLGNQGKTVAPPRLWPSELDCCCTKAIK